MLRPNSIDLGSGRMTSIAQREQVYWDDVNVGDEIPAIELQLTWTTMVEQVDGSQDWNFFHHDFEYARESGHRGIFYNTGWTSSLLSRLVTDWIGDHGWMQKLAFQMRRMNMNWLEDDGRLAGDLVRARGRVTGKPDSDESSGMVELEVWLENDREGTTTPGNALVRLPRRA